MHEEERSECRERLVELQRRLADDVRKSVDRMTEKSGTPDRLSDVPTHAADGDSEGLESETAVEASREEMLEAIDHALARIDEGTYGVCEDCGQAIPKARLDFLPFASRCVACEENREGG